MSTKLTNDNAKPAEEKKEPTTLLSSQQTAAKPGDVQRLTGVDDIAEKLTKTGWDRMEKNHNPFTMTVLQSLSAYGKGDGENARINFNKDKGLNPIGDHLYLSACREAFRKHVQLADPVIKDMGGEVKKKNKGKKKTGKNAKKGGGTGLSKEEIIAQKTADDVKKYLPPLLANHNKTPICREGRAEFRLMQFMLYANHITNELDMDPNSYLAYESLIAMHNAMSSAKGVATISKQCLIDGEEVLERLKAKARFLYEELLTVYPRLVFNNIYSDLYHESIIQPYPDQKRIMDVLSTDKFLAFYNTVPGSGKTTAVVGVVSRAMLELVAIQRDVSQVKQEKAELNKGRKYKLRKRHQPKKSTKGDGNRTTVFVCTNMLVREQVGRDAYNMDIPFAVAANMTYREHFNARSRDVALVISDLESAVSMVEKFTDPVLFIDEPTIAAETDHNINNKIMEVMTYAPRQTILSSATMPRIEELPTLCEMFKHRHKGAEVVHITSRRIGIGCHAVHEGITTTPFQQCTDKLSLERTIKNLNQNPFLFRFLSIEVVVTLRERMSTFNLQFPTFAAIFPNPASITHQKIADHCMDLLDIIKDQATPEQILEICKPLTVRKYRPFQLKTLLTTDAHQHMQGTLYAALDPLEKALELSKLFLADLPSIHTMLKEFNKLNELYLKEKASIEKNVKNDDKRSQQLQALQVPSLHIPSKYIPNTLEHFKKYAPQGTKYDPKALQTPPLTSLIPQDLDVPDEVIMLLYLGIGVYSPRSKILNPERKEGIDTRYTEKVVELCSSGYISFLFADRSIVYGTNFPFSNVFIDPAFAETSSLNTLYQLIGRAGRVGRSYMAKVFLIDKKITDRIVSFSEENIEATNLEIAMNRILDMREIDMTVERVVEEEKKVNSEKRKYKKDMKKEEKKETGTVKKAVVQEEEPEEEEDDWETQHAEAAEAGPEMGEEEDDVADDWMDL